ncbi:MAG: vWA domain-containing protein [Pseudomonadota bacterium]
MIEVLGYFWQRPYWLALIPVAIVAAAFLAHRMDRLGAWERAMDPALLAAMRRMGRVQPGAGRRNWWPALVLALLAIALMGPSVEHRGSVSYRNLDGVVLVLDLSPSVTTGGRLFDTLTAARLVTRAAGTRQTAAVAFAGEAYTLAPFSTDASSLDGTIALVDAETMPVAGSNPAGGLRLARRMIEDAQILSSDVVLVSDGAAIGPDAIAEAASLAARGAPVSVVEVPGDAQGAVSLRALAAAAGGAHATLETMGPVTDLVAGRPVTRLAATGYSMLVLKDYGRYLLLLALIPAFFLLPRRRQR